MQQPLLISSLLTHAERHHGDQQVVSRRVEGDIHRQSYRELGHWIERPASVTERRAQERKRIFAAHPEFGSSDAPVDQLPEDVRTRLQAELQKMRDDMVPFANSEVQRELRELVQKVAV